MADNPTGTETPPETPPAPSPEPGAVPPKSGPAPTSPPVDDIDARIEKALGRMAASGSLLQVDEGEGGSGLDLDAAIDRVLHRRETQSKQEDRLKGIETDLETLKKGTRAAGHWFVDMFKRGW
jgi:hypothetical protein